MVSVALEWMQDQGRLHFALGCRWTAWPGTGSLQCWSHTLHPSWQSHCCSWWSWVVPVHRNHWWTQDIPSCPKQSQIHMLWSSRHTSHCGRLAPHPKAKGQGWHRNPLAGSEQTFEEHLLLADVRELPCQGSLLSRIKEEHSIKESKQYLYEYPFWGKNSSLMC